MTSGVVRSRVYSEDGTQLQCIKCGMFKSLDEFEHNHKYHRQMCRICRNRYTVMQKRKNRFGVSSEEYAKLLAEQGYVCAICQKPEISKASRSNFVKSLAVDHDRATGQVRRLLCQRCNTAIGLFSESPYLLDSAAAYLRRYKND